MYKGKINSNKNKTDTQSSNNKSLYLLEDNLFSKKLKNTNKENVDINKINQRKSKKTTIFNKYIFNLFKQNIYVPFKNEIYKHINDSVVKPTREGVYKPFDKTIFPALYIPINNILIEPVSKVINPISNQAIKPAFNFFANSIDELSSATLSMSFATYQNILLISKDGVIATKNTITFSKFQKEIAQKDNKYLTNLSNTFYKLTIGVLAGVSSLIPGLSGGTIFSATNTLSLVNDSFSSLTNIKNPKRIRESLFFLIPLLAGMAAGYLAFAFFYNFIIQSVPEFQLYFYVFFAFIVLFSSALVLGRNKYKLNKRRTLLYIFFFLIIFVIGLLSFFIFNTGKQTDWTENISRNVELILAFVLGLIMMSTMIVPGVSGSLILLVIGLYEWAMQHLINFDWAFIGIFIGGAIVGLIITAKIINYLSAKYPEGTFFSIFGTMNASFIVVLLIAPWLTIDIYALAGIPVAIALALSFTYYLARLDKRKNE